MKGKVSTRLQRERRNGHFPAARDEAGAGAPPKQVLWFGETWATRSIVISAGRGAIMAVAIGPLWLYCDEWPEAKLLRERDAR